MQHTQNIFVEIDETIEVEFITIVYVNKIGKYFSGDLESPPEYPFYEIEVKMSELEWEESIYTDEENKKIREFVEKNKNLLQKQFETKFQLKNPKWASDEYVYDYDDYRDYDDYARGGKIKKMYAILVSPMGETIADVEVERQDEREARDKFRQMGITQTGSIRFSNTPPYYYQQGGELEEVLMDKIYDAEFGMYRIGDFFIIPDENENFPYHVTNREGAILYKAESLMDAADWADSRYYENGGLADSGQEIVVVAKDLDKDGGGRYKFRFLVYEEDTDEAKKVAAALWEKSFSNSDLSVVEILTAQEWRKKYFKDGGLVSFDELAEATTETLKEAINKYQQQIDILNKIASPTVRDFAEFSGLSSQIAEIKKILRSRGETFKKGGKVKRVRFIDKVESISERLEGTKVPAKLKKDYGGRYSREEAEEAARRIAGAQLRDRKMSDGGMTDSRFIKLSDYFRTLPDKELLVGLRVYDEINEEYIYIKSVEGGIFAGKSRKNDDGLIYSMKYLLVNKKDIPAEMMADGGVAGEMYNIYAKLTASEYFGTPRKGNTIKWFKLNEKPYKTYEIAKERADLRKQDYEERLGRPIQIHIGGLEYGSKRRIPYIMHQNQYK